MLGGVPFANRVEPYVLGLPFLLFWIVLWVVMTSVVMGVVYALDRPTLVAGDDEDTTAAAPASAGASRGADSIRGETRG